MHKNALSNVICDGSKSNLDQTYTLYTTVAYIFKVHHHYFTPGVKIQHFSGDSSHKIR